MTKEHFFKYSLTEQKYSEINLIKLKRIVHLVATIAIFVLCGFFAFPLLCKGKDFSGALCAHFCSFFGDMGLIESLRAFTRFCLPDLVFLVFLTFSGYTMIPSIICKTTLSVYGFRIGYSLSVLYENLILSPIICNGTGAFILFISAKFVIVCTFIYSVLKSEDFSFSFSSDFAKLKHPLVGKNSLSYLKNSASLCGCTIIINAIYLIFLTIQKFTPI